MNTFAFTPSITKKRKKKLFQILTIPRLKIYFNLLIEEFIWNVTIDLFHRIDLSKESLYTVPLWTIKNFMLEAIIAKIKTQLCRTGCILQGECIREVNDTMRNTVLLQCFSTCKNTIRPPVIFWIYLRVKKYIHIYYWIKIANVTTFRTYFIFLYNNKIIF